MLISNLKTLTVYSMQVSATLICPRVNRHELPSAPAGLDQFTTVRQSGSPAPPHHNTIMASASILTVVTVCLLEVPQLADGLFWGYPPERIWSRLNRTDPGLCPQEEDWCVQPSFYPEGAVLDAVTKEDNSLKKLLLIDAFAARSHYEEEDEFVNVCDVKMTYITPRAAKNTEGKFRFIVNHPEGGGEHYTQLVRVARCVGAGEECSAWGRGGGTMCRQEFLDHKLVALAEDGEQLVIDTFTFPSCCSCVISKYTEF